MYVPLSRLINLQFLYLGFGVCFNLISWWSLSQTGDALTPTNPIIGICVMSIYALFVLTGKVKSMILYRVLMFLSVLIFAYGGIIVHIGNLLTLPELYASFAIGILAILINVYGLFLNILASLGRFSIDIPSH